MATEMQSPLPAGARGRGRNRNGGARDRRAGKGRDYECGRVRPDGLVRLEYTQEGRKGAPKESSGPPPSRAGPPEWAASPPPLQVDHR